MKVKKLFKNFFSTKKIDMQLIQKRVKKLKPITPTNLEIWINSWLNAHKFAVKFNGNPPNIFDLIISAIKKKLAMMKPLEIREILSK